MEIQPYRQKFGNLTHALFVSKADGLLPETRICVVSDFLINSGGSSQPTNGEISEELDLKSLIATIGNTQSILEIRVLTERVEQRIGSQVWIREKPAIHAAAQGTESGGLVAQH